MSTLIDISRYRRKKAPRIHFTRIELNQLLNLYSRRVISGEWKDYAMDHGPGMSAFSVFKDSGALPAFTIYKFAGGNGKKGNYAVGSGDALIKRSQTLTDVISVLERQLALVKGARG